MSRVVTTENAKVVREYVSPMTVVHWDPVTNAGMLVYHINELLFINDEFIQSTPKTNVSIPLETLVGRSYLIEVANNQFQEVSGALIMAAFKKAFEDAVESGSANL